MIHFYFDFISPYAYLGFVGVRRLCREKGTPLVLRPVLFAGLLGHWGQLGPAEIPPKRVFTFKDVLRRAAEVDAPLNAPASHPFNPLTALRAALPEVAGDRQEDVVAACFRAAWVDGVDMSDTAALTASLDAAGLGGAALLAKTREPEVKARLKEETAAAVQAGIFGVPSVRIGDEVFWGQDRLVDVRRYLDGEDPIEPDMLARFLAIPASANRPR